MQIAVTAVVTPHIANNTQYNAFCHMCPLLRPRYGTAVDKHKPTVLIVSILLCL